MTRSFCPAAPHKLRKGRRFLVAFFWVAGLLCGAWIGLSADSSLFFWLRGILWVSPSVTGLLCVVLFPFLMSVLVVFLFRPGLLLLVCFGKAFLYAFASVSILLAFGSAGWLFRWLLLFHDCVCAPVLYWFWLHYLPGNRSLCIWDAAWMLSIGLLAGSLDYSVVVPFLARLIEI